MYIQYGKKQVVKVPVIRQKAAWPPHMQRSIVFADGVNVHPHLTHGSLGPNGISIS